ncbi:MAG: hypothetical protein DME26_23125 [Verrucomicrobia bacterium]|nr:MAG: hypothetical protein DME26_23125 [Verrucomicrobiota bacterium]
MILGFGTGPKISLCVIRSTRARIAGGTSGAVPGPLPGPILAGAGLGTEVGLFLSGVGPDFGSRRVAVAVAVFPVSSDLTELVWVLPGSWRATEFVCFLPASRAKAEFVSLVPNSGEGTE